MKLTIDHSLLADAVATAARSLPTRPPAPVLAGLKLTAADGQLTITGFDYDSSASATAAAHLTEDGSVVVPGRLLNDITRMVRREVRLTTDGTRLVVESGSTRYTLHTLPLEEYPTLPATPDASGVVSGKEFAAAVAQVARAAGNDDTLPTLTGVQITDDGDTLCLAATDRYRFAVRHVPWERMTDGPDGAQALIPAKRLLDITKPLADDHEITVGLPTDQGVFGLTGEHTRSTVRVLEGALPKYKSMFPTEFCAQASVNTAALADAVKRVALVATGSTPVRLRFEDGTLTIEGGTSDDAQAVDHIDVDLEGDSLGIAFNPAYLLDGLTAIGTDAVQFGFTDAVKPALLHGAGDPEGALRYLLMPVRLT